MLETLKDLMPSIDGTKVETSLSISYGEILRPNSIDNQQVTEQEILNAFEQTKSVSGSAALLKISYRQVNKVLLKYKIQGIRKTRKKVKFNDDFFELIDTESKAYFLGLFHADGSYFTTKQGKEIFAIRLHEKDKELIQKLLLCLDLPTSYMEILPKESQVGFRISTSSFVQHLRDIKSTKLLARIPTHLRRHFIRGIFDGDGTIYSKTVRHRFRYYYAGFIGFLPFIEFIQDNIPDVRFSVRPTNSNGIYRAETYSKQDLLAFYEFMYEGATLFLNRKHSKFLDMKFLYGTSTTK